jgi:hypothetical protein
MDKNIVLLGDSVFDNKAYVGQGGNPVEAYLEEFSGSGYRITSLAEDGARIEDVYRQAASIPEDAAKLLLSAGGNNITAHISYLQQPAESVAEVLLTFRRIVDEFTAHYNQLIEHLGSLGIPLTVCTIYNCAFPSEEGQKCVETALALFDDAIIQTAYRYSLPYIDLRMVCGEKSDYVNEIEPSDSGGKKIAEALLREIRM